MEQRIIRLCYRKIIAASAQKTWDKYVFENTYTEFLLQAQFYNREKKYTSFSELLLYVKGAEKLHFLVSAAVTNHMQQLNEQMPDIIDNLGKQFLLFKNYRFEIINSDVNNKNKYQVALSFFSEPLVWHGSIGNFLLFRDGTEAQTDGELLTSMVQLQTFLSVCSIKKACFDQAI